MQLISPLVCLTLLWAGEVPAEIVLEQPKSTVTVSIGGDLPIQCRMSGGRIGSYWMYWYRKSPDSSLTFIYRSGDYYGPGFQGHFIGKVDSSNNRFTLRLLQATMSDEGIYYCAARSHSTATILPSGSETRRRISRWTKLISGRKELQGTVSFCRLQGGTREQEGVTSSVKG
uniref:Ig-like domain-containing protein n=1 Tax=Ornithorhynchus anatinus TaxID=9258 RepID=A0A6I8NH53_ORNAN